MAIDILEASGVNVTTLLIIHTTVFKEQLIQILFLEHFSAILNQGWVPQSGWGLLVSKVRDNGKATTFWYDSKLRDHAL